MDFSIPPTIVDMLPRVRELIDREVVPLEPALMAKPFSELVPRLTEVRQQVKKLGLWAPHNGLSP
jgi:acyl-CoA dehydrogenase